MIRKIKEKLLFSVKGLSLVEIMVVTVIVVIMVGILTLAIIQIHSVFQSADVQVTLQADSRIAVNNIIADLRRTSNSRKTILVNTPVAGTDTIVFRLPADADADGIPDLTSDVLQWDTTDITIRLDPATLQIKKTLSGSPNFAVLANNVKSIRFYDHALDVNLGLNELRVVLGLEKSNPQGRIFNFTSTSIINMRN